jgi:hypothetical protein
MGRRLQRDELFQKLLEQRRSNDGMDIWRVTSAISKHISGEQALPEQMLLAQTIPDFTDFIRQVVADAFGDQEKLLGSLRRVFETETLPLEWMWGFNKLIFRVSPYICRMNLG